MAKAKAIKVKKEKAPREVKRNIPWIEAIFSVITAIQTLATSVLVTYLCTWSLYVMSAMRSTEEVVINFAGMMEYIKAPSNINFMVSYIFCGFVFWAVIGFVLAQLEIKLIKYIINYK